MVKKEKLRRKNTKKKDRTGQDRTEQKKCENYERLTNQICDGGRDAAGWAGRGQAHQLGRRGDIAGTAPRRGRRQGDGSQGWEEGHGRRATPWGRLHGGGG